MTNIIIQNEAKCTKCGDIIWSGHTHDYKTCKCGAISVDGGMSYIKRGYKEVGDIEERSLATNKSDMLECIEAVQTLLADKEDEHEVALAVAKRYKENPKVYWSLDVRSDCIEAVKRNKDTGRNSFGIVLAVIRALRDNDVLDMNKFNQEEDGRL